MKHFDVVVIGGGHAGVEAALAASRRGANTALVTFSRFDLGVMSCNPAIGGIGKGHLVREIDALGGMMGLAGDYASIQYRLLNRSRGPAVQGPRVQADRERYTDFVQSYVGKSKNLSLVEAQVVDLIVDGDRVDGVCLEDGSLLHARAVVLTAGTFLAGEIHIGEKRIKAGRKGAASSDRLASRLREVALGVGRLKTGTPARLDAETINWEILGVQKGDTDPTFLSFRTDEVAAEQISCGVTATNERTHGIVRDNIHRSAMHLGAIEGRGPRYCPSLEDKITRFADKTSHNIFLEPEGLNSKSVYPNGISTSLPEAIQSDFIHSIRGLENARILQPGYAIEYDFFDPRSLSKSLEHSSLSGLFLAGQVNGTTGYEEAAAQGLVAGANAAALACELEVAVFSRDQSYIGVMLDDLTNFGVTEPYRMFTSRAEYRLTLRADNADQRLTYYGAQLGLIGPDQIKSYQEKIVRIEQLKGELNRIRFSDEQLELICDLPNNVSTKTPPISYLASMDAGFGQKMSNFGLVPKADVALVRQLQIDEFYKPYVERQKKEAASLLKEAEVSIPTNFSYETVGSLSNELRQKLNVARPKTLGAASKIEGMTPAALVTLLAHIRSRRTA